jgi:hypothetical protein
MKFFLISGYAGSGKTTAGEILCELLKPHVSTTAFAKAVKDQVSEIYGIERHRCDSPSGKKSFVNTADFGRKTVRDLLIDHSARMKFEHRNNGYWADIVAEEIENSPFKDHNWVIHDWRYSREIQNLRVAFPEAQFIKIRIVRSSVIPLSDPSEHDLDDFAMDHIIVNDGSTQELTEKLRSIIE